MVKIRIWTLWTVTPCCKVADGYQNFGEIYCLLSASLYGNPQTLSNGFWVWMYFDVIWRVSQSAKVSKEN